MSRPPRAQAVAVQDGVIRAVGSQAGVARLCGPGARRIDCQGMTLLPGFVDAHCHLLALAASLTGVDCRPENAGSIEILQQALRHRAQQTPPGRWVRGFGYDDLSLAEGRHPTRHDLDQAVPQHPVRLDHRSGHAAVLNSRGLALVGITSVTPDPPEGVIDRDETGAPTGLLLEAGGWLRQRLGQLRDPQEVVEGVGRMEQLLLGYGITSVQDAGPENGLARWQAFQTLKKDGRLRCRVTMLAGFRHLAELMEAGLAFGAGDNHLRLGHVKLLLTLTTGALHPSAEVLTQQVAQAHRMGFPVAVHAVEQEAVAAAAAALVQARCEPPPTPLYERGAKDIAPFANGNNISPPFAKGANISPHFVKGGRGGFYAPDRIEHCAECPPHLLEQVLQTKAMVATQPGFVYWNGDNYRRHVEAALLPHLYPAGALHRAGVPLAFGSDAPVVDPNPWPAIYSAVTRLARSGAALLAGEEAKAVQAVSLEAALRAYTLGGAQAEGAPVHKGSIAVGKLADLVLVDGDPTRMEQEGIKDIKAVMTLVGGKVVWER